MIGVDRGIFAFAAMVLSVVSPGARAQEAVRVFAAGSLRAAMTEIAAAFTTAEGARVVAEFGPSGLLRDRLAQDEPAGIFASANVEHPATLAASGKWGRVRPFASNRLCALVAPGLDVGSDNLLDRMLDPLMRVGTSTPYADPSGDYAVELFAKADKVRPGAGAALKAKALHVTGGPTSATLPDYRSAYALLVAEGKADIFLTYCSSAQAARRENASLAVVEIPRPLAVGASYGLTVKEGASERATQFAQFVLSDEGQRILASHGFGAPGSP